MSINNRFSEFREMLGYSQAELSSHCGLKHGAISVYERKSVDIPEYIIIILELKFRLNRAWLLTGKGDILVPESEIEERKMTMAAESAERYGMYKLKEIADELDILSKRLRAEIEQKKVE